MTTHVLFVCVENSCRSQMAEGFARALAGSDVAAFSAGSRPGEAVHPTAIRLMKEVGIPIGDHRPTELEDLPDVRWDHLVTMGCGDACPHLPAQRRHDWNLPDPKEMDDDAFRRVRDDIHRRVEQLLL